MSTALLWSTSPACHSLPHHHDRPADNVVNIGNATCAPTVALTILESSDFPEVPELATESFVGAEAVTVVFLNSVFFNSVSRAA
mmetsp:Transcript_57338/g.110665  ORF Transcript_57338/g.110665 Transcript_57338/m.110665 type:complete len:84 (-) Transcript_57338:173-424(-)